MNPWVIPYKVKQNDSGLLIATSALEPQEDAPIGTLFGYPVKIKVDHQPAEYISLRRCNYDLVMGRSEN